MRARSPVSFLLCIGIAGMALLLFYTSSTEKATTWGFEGQAKVDGWIMGNLDTVQLLREGLQVQTQTKGYLTRTASFDHHVNTIHLQYLGLQPSRALFIWHLPEDPPSTIYQFPITFTAGGATPQTMVLSLKQITSWRNDADRVGFVFDPGTNIVLQKLEFTGSNMFQVVSYAWKSFWKPDLVRPYTINFLWGPLLTYNKAQYDRLYTEVPPLADSANWMFYGILGVALLALLIGSWRHREASKRRQYLLWWALLFCGLWLLYDIRMTQEFAVQIHRDYRTWWSQPMEERTLRDRDAFHVFAKNVSKHLDGTERHVFLTSHPWPFYSLMRYYAYPSLPQSLDEYAARKNAAIKHWVVFNRTDITLQDNVLMLDGSAISPPGEIVYTTEPGSFLFTTTP